VPALYAADRADETAAEGEARRELPLAMMRLMNGIAIKSDDDNSMQCVIRGFNLDAYHCVLHPRADESARLTKQRRAALGLLITSIEAVSSLSRTPSTPAMIEVYRGVLATAPSFGGLEDALAQCLIRVLHNRANDYEETYVYDSVELLDPIKWLAVIDLLPLLFPLLPRAIARLHDGLDRETSTALSTLLALLMRAIDVCSQEGQSQSMTMQVHTRTMCGRYNSTLRHIESQCREDSRTMRRTHALLTRAAHVRMSRVAAPLTSMVHM
jgi:hypothetical protein